MRLCGQISIDLPPGDYFDALEHRKRLQEILAYIRDAYPQATLSVRERRERKEMMLTPAAPRSATGALNHYAAE